MPRSPTSNSNSAPVRSVLRVSMALTVSLLLAGCASMGMPAAEPTTRAIPAPPSYLRPATIPPATEGKSPFVVAEERAAVIEHQNTVIARARKAWLGMKDTYAKSFLKRNVFGY